MTAAPSMAEVLCKSAHPDLVLTRMDGATDPRWAQAACFACQRHAQALTAAGFGHVASVEREQWEVFEDSDGDRSIRPVNWKARAEAAEAQVAAVRDVLAEHWDWKAGRVLHAAVLAALDGEATP